MMFDHPSWCGPEFPLAKAVEDFFAQTAPSAGQELLNKVAAYEDHLQLPKADAYEDERLLTEANEKDPFCRNDPLLRHRWEAFLALARFVAREDDADFAAAVKAFNRALGPDGEKTYDRPRGVSASIDRFGPSRLKGGPRVFPALDEERWSPGVFIVHDFLVPRWQQAPGTPPPATPAVLVEKTPILTVASDETLSINQPSAALWLSVEALPGPPGLITPDFWSLGLLGFGTSKGDDKDFLQITHEAFRLTLVPERHLRLRWRLERRYQRLPRVIRGRSAETSAACAAWALMQREPGSILALLDADVAISARLGPLWPGRLEDQPLGDVNKDTLSQKIRLAADAHLASLLFWEKQPGCTFNDDACPPVQPAANLGNAYDKLLVMSKVIRDYKREVVYDWQGGEVNGEPLRDKVDPDKVRGDWIPKETHEDFKNAARKRSAR